MNLIKSNQFWGLVILISITIPSLYYNYKLYSNIEEAEYQRDIWESVHKVDRIHIDHINKDLEESKYWQQFSFDELSKCRDMKLKIEKS